MKKSYFVYTLLSIGVFVLAIKFAGGWLRWFLDPATFVAFVCPLLFLLLAIFGPRAMVDAFRAAMGSGGTTKLEVKRAILFFTSAQKIFLLISALLTLSGIVMTFMGISGPKEVDNMVYFYFAMALLSIFYALLLMLIITIPFKAALKYKLYKLEEEK